MGEEMGDETGEWTADATRGAKVKAEELRWANSDWLLDESTDSAERGAAYG
jgi:hypothetical protein